MNLYLKRTTETDSSTIGELFVNGKFECYILEDPHQNIKIPGKTRIPEGCYQVRFRTNNHPQSHHTRYSKRFPNFHQGMLEIVLVPNFKFVLIHIGNYPKDTQGCLLTGTSTGHDVVWESEKAYVKLYQKVAAAINDGQLVHLMID